MHEGTYVVRGMSCERCVRAVEAEVGKLAGVSQVDVDLSTGLVRIASEAPVAAADVAAAVEAAGYEVAT